MAVFPEHPWDINNFEAKPSGFLHDPNARKTRIEQIKQRLGITKMEDWYGVTTMALQNAGGSGFLKQNGRSVSKTIVALFPDHNWELYRFKSSIDRHVSTMNAEELRKMFTKLSRRFEVENLEDWYRISVKQLRNAKLFAIADTGLDSLLRKAYAGFSRFSKLYYAQILIYLHKK